MKKVGVPRHSFEKQAYWTEKKRGYKFGYLRLILDLDKSLLKKKREGGK